MATNYPAALDSYSTKVDNVTDVLAAHVNDLQDAVVAIETELGIQPRHVAAAAPTVNDDTAYSVGTLWLDTTNDKIYICIDNSNGAAIWREVGLADYVKALTAADLYITYGSPAYGTLLDSTYNAYGMPTWRLDDAATETIGCAFEYKGLKSGSTIYVDVWYAMESATSGDVYIAGRVNALADGEDATSLPSVGTNTVTVPGTAKYIDKTTFTVTESYVTGDLINFCFARLGGNGADTASGDLHFIAATVRFA
jgi:hypothetical protein